MSSKLLKELIEKKDIEKAIEVIKELGYNKDNESVAILINYLETTDDVSLRNAIAIALSDIGNSTAVEPLISLLKDEKTIGARGTLLYALEPFDIRNQIGIIYNLIFDDYYEVQTQAFELLRLSFNKLSNEERQFFKQNLSDRLDKYKEKVEFLISALEELEKISWIVTLVQLIKLIKGDVN